MICRTIDKFVSYSRRQSTSFFHNFKLELYSFCEPCPYMQADAVTRTLCHVRLRNIINACSRKIAVKQYNAQETICLSGSLPCILQALD